ncbi:MAG TPA: hypothetical protein VG821_01110 [Rhizomicrobium sp.]|nr:hypothetical protein [Rhizomicrobium sp.]
MPLTPFQEVAYEVAKSLIDAGRGSLFETPDTDLPQGRSDLIAKDDRIPQIGFVGEAYEIRRILVLGINPGNGSSNTRSPEDSKMMPALHDFVSDSNRGAYAAAMQAQMIAFPNWLASKEIGPILKDEGVNLAEIAYANANPYRVEGNSSNHVFPNKTRERIAAMNWVLPLALALSPRLIIAHGQKAADVIKHCKTSTRLLTYNRNHNAKIRSAANADFVSQFKNALAAQSSN